MIFEKTMRWFGPNDPIALKEIKQAGATGIVTALHQIPVGEVWPIEKIKERQQIISAEGLQWSVVESLPVHEDIKKQKGNYRSYIENYKVSIRNLRSCGIDTICYNFMPILDWSRTNLHVVFSDDTITTKFEAEAFAAFDLFILKRDGAENEYSPEQIAAAKARFDSMDGSAKAELTQTVLLGLPGSLEAYTLDNFKLALKEYQDMSADTLRQHLLDFIREVVPVAEEVGAFMVIHPDDPPWPLLGLPRVVGNINDLTKIITAVDSPSNGLTFCTGSLGAGYKNDMVAMAKALSHRVNFLHLRNLRRDAQGNFMEAYHLDGDLDLYEIMKVFVLEQQKRVATGRKDIRMPIRPDHGNLMDAEPKRAGIYPGYSLLGRMRGLAELRGLELGIRRSLSNDPE